MARISYWVASEEGSKVYRGNEPKIIHRELEGVRLPVISSATFIVSGVFDEHPSDLLLKHFAVSEQWALLSMFPRPSKEGSPIEAAKLKNLLLHAGQRDGAILFSEWDSPPPLEIIAQHFIMCYVVANPLLAGESPLRYVQTHYDDPYFKLYAEVCAAWYNHCLKQSS